MRYLKLNHLTGNDTKAAIATAKIMALMHFPDDAEMQTNYTVVSLANMAIAYGKHKQISQANLPRALSKFLSPVGGFDSLLNALSLKEMRQLSQEAREEAFIAGNILYGIYCFQSMNPEAERNKKLSVNKMVFFMKGKLKERKIREFWSKYRCVSHLWASNIDLYQADGGIEALEIPPYNWLYDLLEGAKFYQNFGLEYWPRYKKQTLFEKEDLWLIPKNIPEPQSPPPSKKDKWIKTLKKTNVKTLATTRRDSEEFKKHAEKWLREQFKGYKARYVKY
jgi:hypothetical protein